MFFGHRFMRMAALAIVLCLPRWSLGQGAVSFGQQRPFVIGWIPVVGPGGAVGGVSIDAQGVIDRCDVELTGKLRDARLKALSPVSADLAKDSRLRKVSLHGLTAALDVQRRSGKPATDEMQNLAGLTRVQYLLVYPEQHDIVLAGPAEGWRVDDQGTVVGQASGQPVLQLDDLLVALRTARKQLTSRELITCSIDPTKEGLERYSRALARQAKQPSQADLERLEAAIGPQTVTLTGVAGGTHFARVLVAADYMMKRLGMNLEAAPIEGLPSYLEMLQSPSAPLPKNSMPRWWMAAKYEPLHKDDHGLAWQLRGPGVQTLAEDGFQAGRGQIVRVSNRSGSLAQNWAEAMTARYDALAAKLPIFAELRNCMDLAVIGALLLKEDLPGRAGCDLAMLYDDKLLVVAEQQVPRTIDSRASFVAKARQTIISVSGGVELDPWQVLEKREVSTEVAAIRTSSAPVKRDRWWWD